MASISSSSNSGTGSGALWTETMDGEVFDYGPIPKEEPDDAHASRLSFPSQTSFGRTEEHGVRPQVQQSYISPFAKAGSALNALSRMPLPHPQAQAQAQQPTLPPPMFSFAKPPRVSSPMHQLAKKSVHMHAESPEVDSPVPRERGRKLLWKKMKDRDRELALKDAEIEELLGKTAVLEVNKANAARELASVKTSAKEAVSLSVKRVEELRTEMELLKRQADERLPADTDIQRALTELRELKETTRNILQELEPLLAPGGACLERQISETKFIVRELQLDVNSRQQIADLLRDRFDAAMVELGEAKTKVGELEDCQNQRITAERAHSEQLRDIATHVAALADSLATEQQKLLEATKQGERLQAENTHLTLSVQEKYTLLEQLTMREQEVANVKLELALVEAQAEDLRLKLTSLRTVADELATCKLHLHDAQGAREQLKIEIARKQTECDSLQEQVSNLNTELKSESSTRIQLGESCRGKDKEITSLSERLSEATRCLNDEGKKRGALEQEIRVVESLRDGESQQVAVLQSQILELEDGLTQARQELTKTTIALQVSSDKNATNGQLESELVSQKTEVNNAKIAHSVLQAEKDRLLIDYNNLQQHSQNLQRQLGDLSQKLQSAVSRSQTLQDRLDEQAVNVRSAKEDIAVLHDKVAQSNGDAAAQAALSSSLKTEITKLEQQHAVDQTALEDARRALESLRVEAQTEASTAGHLRAELATTYDQKSGLQLLYDQTRLALETERAESRGKEALYEQRLASREDESALRAQVWEAQKAHLEQALRSAEQSVADRKAQIISLQKNFEAHPSADHRKELELTQQLEAMKLEHDVLQTEIGSLKEAALTIGLRYDRKNLSNEEKELVSRIAQDARSLYEKDIVSKLNELKKRENTINELQSRNKLLEDQIAKQLQNQSTSAKPAVSLLSFEEANAEASNLTVPNSKTTQDPVASPAAQHSEVVETPLRHPRRAHGQARVKDSIDIPGDISATLRHSPGRRSDDPDYVPIASVKTARKRPAPAHNAKGTDTQATKRAV